MVRFIEDADAMDPAPGEAIGERQLRHAEKTITVDFIDDEPPPLAPRKPARWPHWHVWAVGGLSLPWNMIGATDYAMSEFRNGPYLAQSADMLGISVFELIAQIGSYPAWAVAAWAFGTWGAVTGSLLLLARNRFAVVAFAISLVGLAIVTAFRKLAEQPDWASRDGPFQILIWLVAIGLLVYSEWARRKRLLT